MGQHLCNAYLFRLWRILKGPAYTLILLYKHLFSTRNTYCGGAWRDTNNSCYFLIRHSLDYIQYQGSGIVLRHVCYGESNVLAFGNLCNTTVVRRQEETLITTCVGCERPPGDTLAPSKKIDGQMCGNTIQPAGEVIAITQTIPGGEDANKHLLGHIIRILLTTESAVDIGVG